MTRARAGFTLIEIVISLAILAVSLTVLVESEASAVVMTVDSEQTLTANTLAEQTMAEVLLKLEIDGISESDQYGEGDYSDFGEDGKFGQGVSFSGEYDEYHYAWTVRKVDMQIGDASQAITDLQEMGVSPTGESTSENGMDPSMLSSFMSPDMLNEMLSPWMREVRVLVWWGEDPGDLESDVTCESCVELVSHVFNQSGKIMDSESETTDSETSASSASSSASSSSKPKSSGSSPRGGTGVGGRK